MIVFFDIDGTLVSDDPSHTIPKSTTRAIRAARENGHLMYINTGRTMNNVDDYIREIGFDGYICGCGTYIESGGKTLFYRTVPKDICLKMAELMYECRMSPVYERTDSFFLDKRLKEKGGLAELKVILTREGKQFSRDISDPDFSFDKLVAWYDEGSDLERFKDGIKEHFDYIDRGYGFCELAAKGFSKGSGIEVVCRHHNVPITDTIAIGDSLNDMPMLTAAGHSVAMGESRSELIEAVEYVTTPLYEGGIENALKHYNLV